MPNQKDLDVLKWLLVRLRDAEEFCEPYFERAKRHYKLYRFGSAVDDDEWPYVNRVRSRDILAFTEDSTAIIMQTLFASMPFFSIRPQAERVLELDRAFCPRTGPTHTAHARFDFAADRVLEALGEMERPPADAFEGNGSIEFEIHHPAQVGEVLVDPDGGAWMRGRIRAMRRDGERVATLPAWFVEQGGAEHAGA